MIHMKLLAWVCIVALWYGVAEAGNQPSSQSSEPVKNEAGESEESQVTITKQTEQTIEEYRVGGRLYMIKITPKHGKPYYLVDDRGDGKFARQEGLDTGFRPPRWVLHQF